jgi:hypothetical protein
MESKQVNVDGLIANLEKTQSSLTELARRLKEGDTLNWEDIARVDRIFTAVNSLHVGQDVSDCW